MSDLILTQDQIKEVTGYVQQTSQAKWLRDNRFKFLIGGDGLIKLSRNQFDLVMGATIGKGKNKPDFSNL